MLLLVYYYYYYYYEQQSCELNIKVSGLDRFRRFSTAHSSDKQTHTQTHIPRYVCNNRPRLVLSRAMRDAA